LERQCAADERRVRIVELRHLRYFVAVAEDLNFSRAAERLHVAQPAVSEQVRKLEEKLGVRLLDRTPRAVSLTNAGAALLDEARRILHQVELAKVAVQDASERARSQLRIGYMPDLVPAVVPRALQRLATTTPHLDVRLQTGAGPELVEFVRSERLDAAIVSLPAQTNGLRTTPLGTQRAIAAIPVGHRHAMDAALRLDQLAPERIVVLPRDFNRPLYDTLVATWRRAGLSPTLVETPDASVEGTLLAVASGVGIALLPESVADRYSAPGVRLLPLAGEQPEFETAVVSRRDSTHIATAAFLHAVASRRDHASPRTVKLGAVGSERL
jgi:DNA-binding transcriptional LysR family regulator